MLKMQHSTRTISVCMLILLLTQAVLSKPTQYSTWEEYKEATGKRLKSKDNKCRHGGPVKDLCEQCSKITKNELAFPLCCEDDDEEGVRSWCVRFMGFTLKEN